jgi:NAD(P)-dependent dehydrogenase (short-subunit alcohol dehydrogenase family)
MSSNRFAGKTALVTGAGSGIGRATALGFAREGAQVVVSDVSVENGEATVAAIQAAGGDARFFAADVSDAAAVEALVASAVKWYAKLDCAYNNAGIFIETEATADCDDTTWDAIMNINLKGVFLCMKHELRAMVKQGSGGAIVNASSATAYRTVPKSPAYSASKAAIATLTRVAAIEYGAHQIRINAIAPAGIETPMLQKGLSVSEERRRTVAQTRILKRLATAEEAAEAVLWLCSDQSSYVTGHTLFVDGGAISAP